MSSINAYKRVLEEGCRCIELDVWDGSYFEMSDDPDLNEEPIIYHGHTLTSKILLRDVLEVIRNYAFVTSKYPVILSIENHCSIKQQQDMADYFFFILGDKLLTEPLPDHEEDWPSPEDLAYKIIIKGKKNKKPKLETAMAAPTETTSDDTLLRQERTISVSTEWYDADRCVCSSDIECEMVTPSSHRTAIDSDEDEDDTPPQEPVIIQQQETMGEVVESHEPVTRTLTIEYEDEGDDDEQRQSLLRKLRAWSLISEKERDIANPLDYTDTSNIQIDDAQPGETKLSIPGPNVELVKLLSDFMTPKKKEEKGILDALADLTVYCHARHFKTFDDAINCKLPFLLITVMTAVVVKR